MEKQIIPAIIAKSQDELEKAINKVKDHVEILQLDFMDGKFVPNTSLDFDLGLPALRYEAHLMVAEPKKWIEKYLDQVEIFLVHFESTDDPQDIIDFVKNEDKKIGFVINPQTSVEKITPYIEQLDQVLVMTVNPGFYGSKFVPEALDKVTQLRKMAPDLNIEVDGSINDKTIIEADKAGANLFVSGSYILKSDDPKKAIETLKSKLEAMK